MPAMVTQKVKKPESCLTRSTPKKRVMRKIQLIIALAICFSTDLEAHHDGAPTGLTATPANNTASVAFTAPASNGGATITNYEYSINNGGWARRNPATSTSLVSITGRKEPHQAAAGTPARGAIPQQRSKRTHRGTHRLREELPRLRPRVQDSILQHVPLHREDDARKARRILHQAAEPPGAPEHDHPGRLRPATIEP